MAVLDILTIREFQDRFQKIAKMLYISSPNEKVLNTKSQHDIFYGAPTWYTRASDEFYLQIPSSQMMQTNDM